jgi:HPt (histidine-containing phosphotransfer) domain-containing protein
MQTPVMPDLLLPPATEHGRVRARFSVVSQLKLRALYEYLDFCQDMIETIQQDIASADMQSATRHLERFCIEADSWGFNSLYEIGSSLQMTLLNADEKIWNSSFRDALRRGLTMLLSLLEECEREFCSRLATADTLDAISEASGN